MVELVQNNWHQIYKELVRWREILGTEWNRDKRVYIT